MLRQPASDRHDAAVRWRQLVDLIARAGPAADSHVLEEALAVIREDAPRIDEPLRAAAARAIAALPLPLGLLQCFIADELAVSAPILAAASLDPGQWQALLAEVRPETRRFVETIHPELAIGQPRGTESASEDTVRRGERTIGEMVARIERRRREQPATMALAEPEPRIFRWECAANGDIAWVEGVPRGALIGRSIAKTQGGSGDRLDPMVSRAFGQRAPFQDAELVLAGDGPVAGQWKISGVPAFDHSDGRFAGYRGIAFRSAEAMVSRAIPDLAGHALPLDGDSLRELVHEIKTPLNAIIGFAEIIDGQYLGPAGRRYRSRANDIARQARVLLSAIDDLDLAARFQAARITGAAGRADLAKVAVAAVAQLQAVAEQRRVELVVQGPARPIEALADEAFLGRLSARFLEAIVELAVSGEKLRATIGHDGRNVRLSVTRPVGLAGFNDRTPPRDEGAIAGLFSLRLARGLARIGGGDIAIGASELVLAFPKA